MRVIFQGAGQGDPPMLELVVLNLRTKKARTKALVQFFDFNFIVVNFLLQGVAIDSEQKSGFHLIAVVGAQSDFQKRAFNLLHNNVIETVEFNIGVFLLLEENLELALNEFFKSH
jgi:hypothetical protein